MVIHFTELAKQRATLLMLRVMALCGAHCKLCAISSRILTKHGQRFIQLPQKKENKIVIKLWRRNVHFIRTQKLRDVGALNSKNNDAHAKDDDVVMEAFVIVLNGERHPEIKVFCPRTLHNARSGLAPRPYDLDCSALTDVHCVFQKCH